jgi:hypothetical protein
MNYILGLAMLYRILPSLAFESSALDSHLSTCVPVHGILSDAISKQTRSHMEVDM